MPASQRRRWRADRSSSGDPRADLAPMVMRAELRNRIRLPRHDRIPRRDQGGGPPPLTPHAAGWYRPAQKPQDPDVDPHEPASGESYDAGHDHGWSNCTMASGAVTLDFHTLGALNLWAGDLRHAPGQPDMTGGTDLWDVQKAWAYYGQELEIRSGAGWSALQSDRAAGRAILLTGEGDVPGSATFDGAHAIAVLPETHSDGRWLQADPLCTGPEWVTEAALREWAERLQSSINYARTAAHPPASSLQEGDMPINSAAGLVTGLVVDVPEKLEFYADPNLTRRLGAMSKAARIVYVGNPIGETVEGGSRAVQLNTGSAYSDGSVRPTIVYMAAGAIDPISLPAPANDIDEAIAQRDEEWRQWFLDGSPGDTP